ncbi:MAG: ABC transporter ATP-binding protein, partial [Candidatus Ratteibacteria bacterium]
SGLDSLARKELSDIFTNLGKEGKTIIISSHILTELSDFCTSVGIMENGKMKRWEKSNSYLIYPLKSHVLR